MKRILTLSALILSGLVQSQPHVAWHRITQSGQDPYDFSTPVAVRAAANGNIYVLTHAPRSTPFAVRSAFVTCYNPFGVRQWNLNFDETNFVNAYESLEVDSQSNLYITGYRAPFGSTTNTGLVLSYDSAGAARWSKNFVGAVARTIAVDDATSSVYVAVAGSGDKLYRYAVSDGGLMNQNTSFATNFHINRVVVANGSVFVVGELVSTAQNLAVVKLATNLVPTWSRAIPQNGFETTKDLKVHSDGSVLLLADWSQGAAADYFVARLTAAGNIAFAKRFSRFPDGFDFAKELLVNSDGTCCFTGTSYTSSETIRRAVLYKVSTAGAVLNLVDIEANGSGTAGGITSDASGDVFVSAVIGINASLTKFSPAGAIVWRKIWTSVVGATSLIQGSTFDSYKNLIQISSTTYSGRPTAFITKLASLRFLGSSNFNVPVGGQRTINVSLLMPAPEGGAAISLASDNAGALSVPPEVVIPAGLRTVSFLADGVSATASVRVIATYGGHTIGNNFSVGP